MPAKKQICTTPLRIPVELREWAKAHAASKKCSLNALMIDLLIELRGETEQKKN
ncbi:hypothetical protein [Janthinobacterium sp. MDT1-19]|uniref:hypothetical protein n=1 Tax=Janthinobacterium sp. MDT1-19 TaxID=1259339 RepID=UPI003F5240F2